RPDERRADARAAATLLLRRRAASTPASLPRRLAHDRGSHPPDLGRAGRRARASAHRGNGAALQRPVRGTVHPRLRALGATGAARARQPVARGVPRLRARSMDNRALARVLRDLAAYLEMEEVPFKPRAYEKAAQAVESEDRPLVDVYAQRGLPGLR